MNSSVRTDLAIENAEMFRKRRNFRGFGLRKKQGRYQESG